MSNIDHLKEIQVFINGRPATEPLEIPVGGDFLVKPVNPLGQILDASRIKANYGASLGGGKPVFGPDGITDTTSPDPTTSLGFGFRLNANAKPGQVLNVSADVEDNHGHRLTKTFLFTVVAGGPAGVPGFETEVRDRLEKLDRVTTAIAEKFGIVA